MHFANRIAHALGGLEQGRDGEQAGLGVGRLDLVPEHAGHGLGDRQVARGLQHQHPIARLLQDRGLAERADVIDARAGARIGQEDQARIEQHGHAVGHRKDISAAKSAANPSSLSYRKPVSELMLWLTRTQRHGLPLARKSLEIRAPTSRSFSWNRSRKLGMPPAQSSSKRP